MFSSPPHYYEESAHAAICFVVRVFLMGVVLFLTCQAASGQIGLPNFQERSPLAKIAVQSLRSEQPDLMVVNNGLVLSQPEEDPLSFYVRTQDGEWIIPTQVNQQDPWVRLLLLSPGEPTIIDIAIELNEKPFRAAREQWIDKLLAEAKSTSRTRAGSMEELETTTTTKEMPILAIDKTSVSNESVDEKIGEKAEQNSDKDEAKVDSNSVESKLVESESAKPDVPMVTPQARQSRGLFRRLINYLAADQSTADREEVRWLLAEWTGGPALLTLSPAFAWRRANEMPLWMVLDVDGDQILSFAEIERAETSLKQADANRDDISGLAELQSFGKERLKENRTKRPHVNAFPLLVVLDNQTDWSQLERQLASAYIAPGKKLQTSLTAGLSSLLSLPADAVYRVSFSSQMVTAQAAQATLLSVNQEANKETNKETNNAWQFQSSTEQVITVERPTVYIEFTAAQGTIDPKNDSGDMKQTQIALGAIVDGFPLFRLLDTDNNHLLTHQEKKRLPQLLKAFDRNQDQQITRSELPTAIRLAVTHGPEVHAHLSAAIAVQREQEGQTKIKVPDWFVGMDNNQDGDLSRREFQGSSEQFAKFDQDGDGFISQKEAVAE